MKKIIKIIMLFMIFLMSISLVSAFDLTDNLVAYWNFSDTLDSKNAHDLTLFNTPNQIANAVLDQGYQLDGVNQRMEADDSDDFDQTSSMSFCGWINFSDTDDSDYIYADDGSALRTETDASHNCRAGNQLAFIIQAASTVCVGEGGGGDINYTVGQFDFYCVTYDQSNVKFYKNAELIDTVPESNAMPTGAAKFTIGSTLSPSEFITMGIDEWGYFSKDINISHIEELYFAGVGCNPINNPTTGCFPPPAGGNPTAVKATKLNTTNVTFATDVFFDAFVLEFTITEAANVSLISSFNIEKISGGATNEVFGQLLYDDVVVSTESLRTVATTGDIGSSGFKPITTQLAGGAHNLTVRYRRTSPGTILIDNTDFVILQHTSGADVVIKNQLNTTEYTHATNGFVAAYNWSIGDSFAKTFIINKMVVTGTVAANTRYFYQDLTDFENSTYVARRITGSGNVGSISNIFMDEGDGARNFTIMSDTSAGTVTVNTSILSMSLEDVNNNTIAFFNQTNTSTTRTSNITLSAGNHKIVKKNFSVVAGDSLILMGGVSIISTSGAQTPVMVINSTNTSLICESKKDRSLADNSDIGNLYAYTICNTNLIVNTTYEFDLWLEVPAGESLILLDEILTGMESIELNGTTLPTVPALTITSNLSTTSNFNFENLSVKYNLTISEFNAFNLFNCSLISNSVINATHINITNGTTNKFNMSFADDVEEDFVLSIFCESPEINATTGDFTYKVDRIVPQLTTDFVNNSILYHNLNQFIDFQVFANDTNLFAMNVTLYLINGTNEARNDILNSTFLENLTTTTANISILRDTSSLNNSRYEFAVDIWDSHTTNIISDYQWEGYQVNYNSKTYKGISFNNNYLNISSDDYNLIDDFALVKKRDRYLFAFNFNTINQPIDIYLDSKKGITYIPTSEYDGHFVIGMKHWLDFESDDVQDLTVTYIQSANVYRIRFTPTENVVVFNSIGDLNQNKQSFFFNITDGFTFFANNVITNTSISNFTILVINTTDNSVIQTQNTTNGNITFNLTGSFLTNITSSGFANNNSEALSFTANNSFTYQMFAANSLFLFFYNEDTNALINDRNVTVQIINLANTSQESITDTGSAFVSGFATGDYNLIFNAPGFFQNQFFTTITSSSTQTIDLFMVPNTTGSLIVFNIRDEKGNPLVAHTLKRKRLVDLDTNAFEVTGMSLTDENGETGQFLVPNTIFYQFIVEDPSGNVLLSTGSQQIFSSLVFLKVNILNNIYESYNLIHSGSLTTLPIDWDNVTNIVSFTYNDASGLTQTGCIQVIQRDVFTETIHGPNCVNSSSATVQINMTPFIDNVSLFIAQGFIITNTTFSDHTLETLSRNFGENFRTFGNLGLYAAYLFIGTMFLLGVTVSFSVAVLFTTLSMVVLGLVGVSFFGWSLIVTISVVGIVIAAIIKN